MKLQTISPNNSPYAKRHPLWKRWLTYLLVASLCFGVIIVFWPFDHFGEEYGFPISYHLHNSEPRTKHLTLKGVNVTLQEPVDNRIKDYSDPHLMHVIKSKINTDLIYFGASQNATEKNLVVKTTVNKFYTAGKGVFWKQSIASMN